MKTSFLLITFSALYCIVTTGQEIKSEIGIKDISKPHSELSVARGKLVSFKIQDFCWPKFAMFLGFALFPLIG